MNEHQKEMAMRKIVVGFDGSDEARDGLRLARALAHGTGAELIVAAAFGPILGGPGVDLQALESEYFADVFAKAEAELGGTSFERRELREVSAPRGLGQLAEEESADVIVIGSAHRGKVGRVLFGSVGERLLYGAPCAVAVAPRGYAGCEHLGKGTIGVAYDGSPESRLALEGALALATVLGGELRLITVASDWSFVLLSNDASRDAYIDAVRGHYRDVQNEALERIGDAPKAEAILEQGEPAAALTACAVDLDLLVMGSRGYGPVRRTLLGAVSAEVMRTSPCPVVVVPRGAGALDDEGRGSS
jgi:nucleotide-binding universal stress UspA family protein